MTKIKVFEIFEQSSEISKTKNQASEFARILFLSVPRVESNIFRKLIQISKNIWICGLFFFRVFYRSLKAAFCVKAIKTFVSFRTPNEKKP